MFVSQNDKDKNLSRYYHGIRAFENKLWIRSKTVNHKYMKTELKTAVSSKFRFLSCFNLKAMDNFNYAFMSVHAILK